MANIHRRFSPIHKLRQVQEISGLNGYQTFCWSVSHREGSAMKRALVCLDHSAAATIVFVQAREFAERYRAELTFLHILVPNDGLTFPNLPLPAAQQDSLQNAKNELRCLMDQVPEDWRGKVLVCSGEPWRLVGLHASDLGVDFIILGAHGTPDVEIRCVYKSTKKCHNISTRCNGCNGCDGRFGWLMACILHGRVADGIVSPNPSSRPESRRERHGESREIRPRFVRESPKAPS
jgi:nucleotide-binding universal stress UspA family protein